MGLGDYPAEYNPAKHGVYDPARYYGKPDISFGEVKLAELPAWVARREKNPVAFTRLLSRAFWRWQHKYVQPRRSGLTPFFQVAVGTSVVFYFLNYLRIRGHANYKYH